MIFSGDVPADEDLACFPLDEINTINLSRAKLTDFYPLLLHKTYTNPNSGPKRWDRSIISDRIIWKEIFPSIRGTCQENKLHEFHSKFIHIIIIVTRKELSRFKIKEDSDCVYCGEADSFRNCEYAMSFTQEVLQWFNATHNSTFNPNTEEILFGLPTATNVIKRK